ncbi:MAG: DNA/RNA nuclease SfsA [Thalassotalea sp.]|nr:DNA/RNA nuclease SfsA [Thalassotalea sp.]
MEVAQSGKRCITFSVLHSGINSVTPALFIDKVYGKLIHQAINSGVEFFAYKCEFYPSQMELKTKLILFTKK